MYVDRHIIYGLIFSISLFPLFSFGAIVIFLASVLIDVDHYIYYVVQTGNIGIKGSIEYFLEKEPRSSFFLHSLEMLSLVLILSFFERTFLYIFLGLSFHILLDMIDMIRNHDFYMQKFTLLPVNDHEPT